MIGDDRIAADVVGLMTRAEPLARNGRTARLAGTGGGLCLPGIWTFLPS
jgi:hypothetical protein